MQAIKQALDDALGTPTSYADLMAIGGAVAVYNTKGPLINVGYGRPDVDGPDPFQGVGSNTNQQRDYPIQAIIDEWGMALSSRHPVLIVILNNPISSCPIVEELGFRQKSASSHVLGLNA
jgi:hypothetical protein